MTSIDQNRYTTKFLVGWRAMDFNGHMANTGYLDLAADGARFAIENEIWSAAGERAATVRSTGGWLDLGVRKLVVPPPALLEVFKRVPRAPGFVEVPSLTGKGRETSDMEPGTGNRGLNSVGQ